MRTNLMLAAFVVVYFVLVYVIIDFLGNALKDEEPHGED